MWPQMVRGFEKHFTPIKAGFKFETIWSEIGVLCASKSEIRHGFNMKKLLCVHKNYHRF